ncbi:MAG: hypothetical protein HY428_02925 [Candidatus Levybacteria bacterium]|nr:hypothetical protein [Candidatus Levybacteria bacterium]
MKPVLHFPTIFLSILTSILGIQLISPIASAQEVSLAINPPIITIQLIPPAAVSNSLSITNKTDQTTAVSIELRPFTAAPSADGRLQFAPQDKVTTGFLRNVQILDGNSQINNITLSPKQQKILMLRVNIPKDAKSQDYYFSILFINKDNKKHQSNDKTNTESILNAGIATNVIISIGPNPRSTASLEEFSSPTFLNSGPVPFVIGLKNTSKHFISAYGQILVKNMFGQTIGKVDLAQTNILSQTNRYIPDTKQSYLEQGSTVVPTAVWPEKFLLGFYKARLELSLSENGPTINREISFLSFPLPLMGIAIFSLIVIVFIRNRVRKRML